MKSKYQVVAALAFVALPACFALGCAAHFESVDGSDAMYVDTAPANIDVYPRYSFHDGYVYDVNGRYYHRHGNRWVVYREAPRGLVRNEHMAR